MPTTKTLPVVHATDLTSWKKCARQAKYAQVLRLRPRGPQRGLDVGTCGHIALQAYYSRQSPYGGVHWSKPHMVFRLAWQEMTQGMVIPEDIAKDADVVEALLERYPEWAKEYDDFTVVQTEQEFEAPIFRPGTDEVVGVHRGKWDLFVMDRTGAVWLMDHKFLARWPSEEVLKRDEQMGWYVLGAHRLLPQYNVRGVMYNVIRKTNPATARDDYFRRWRIGLSLPELRTLEWNLFGTMKRRLEDDLFLPNPGPIQCGGCAYKDLCIMENNGQDPAVIGPQLFDVVEGR